MRGRHPTTVEEDERLFLRALEILGHREGGYRPTRPWSRSRLRDRVESLGLSDEEYLARLGSDPAERVESERVITVAMSHFWRGKRLLGLLSREVLPRLQRQRWESRLWSAGAARGEEAYTLAILWSDLAPLPGHRVRILATDVRRDCLEKAREGRYEAASLRDVPPEVRERWFHREEDRLVLAEPARRLVCFAEHDLLRDPWPRDVDLMLLRHVAFTYWGEELQRQAVRRAADCLRSHGWLAIGTHEALPPGWERHFTPVKEGLPLYRRRS